jgi:colanic acid/amylovoran biosynthesis protein
MYKVVILQIPNSGNNGSAMMAINCIYQIHKGLQKNVKFFCDFSSEKHKERIQAELPSDCLVVSLNLPEYKKKLNNVIVSGFDRIKWINQIVNSIRVYKPNAIVVLGGDDFSEYYSGYKIILKIYLMYRLSLIFPIYMLGHTLGPFYSWRIIAVNKLLSRCYILTRDNDSFYYAKNILKLSNIERGYDLAWLDLPKQTIDLKFNMMDEYGLEENKYVVITPSALVSHYTTNQESYFNTFAGIVETIKNYQVVLMPHVFKDNKKDDRWAISEIRKRLKLTKDILFIDDALLPSHCRALLSGCRFSISSRMHSAVSTAQVGKPTIALSYSVKYAGVIGEDAGLKNLLVEANNDCLWEGELLNIITRKITYIEKNYDSICNNLKMKIDTIKVKEIVILNRYIESMKGE